MMMERSYDSHKKRIPTPAKWFVYLLLIFMHSMWIDGIEARQHDGQINEAGPHHSRSIGRGSSYETYARNNNNKVNHQRHHHHHNKNRHGDSGGGHRNAVGANNEGGNGRKRGRHGHRRERRKEDGNLNYQPDDNISLWINEQQLKILTALFFPQGYVQGPVYAIHNGHVMNDIKDGRIYNYLIIPPEVDHVNFTWKAGHRKYFYHFDLLETMDERILKAPTVSIKIKGRIPKEEKNFSVFLPCAGNNSGTAMFYVGLTIHNRSNEPLPGTPIRLHFKKECAHRGVYDNPDTSNPTQKNTSLQGPDPLCHLKCGEHGFCNHHNVCQCHSGYIGQYCEKAFCFPQCMNGGNCTAPSVCTCPDGYQGTQCEGGICSEKCLNGGKCVQKDKCNCRRGYYGLRCEYSKCEISCMHGGRCIGTNLCRCAEGLSGNHCEIGNRQRSTCKRKCRHGVCMPNKTCKCKEGFYGRYCNQRVKKH
ncbi:protein shifted isoform X2 [Stomoxys calcitrans]|nr:protein shifted isoform X2 [Stomoxys calcitrans]XP_059219199.1 protein shifted isoform X2 [Stomoxys calcitrans]